MATILAFDVERQRFGVPLADVREVARAVSVVRLPKAPPIVEGAINIRGDVVPVLDFRARFRLTPKGVEPSDQLVVAHAGDRTVAIRVDRVRDVVPIDEDDIERIDKVTPRGELIAGIAKLPDGLILIHDLSTFLTAAESEALSAAQSAGSS